MSGLVFYTRLMAACNLQWCDNIHAFFRNEHGDAQTKVQQHDRRADPD